MKAGVLRVVRRRPLLWLFCWLRTEVEAGDAARFVKDDECVSLLVALEGAGHSHILVAARLRRDFSGNHFFECAGVRDKGFPGGREILLRQVLRHVRVKAGLNRRKVSSKKIAHNAHGLCGRTGRRSSLCDRRRDKTGASQKKYKSTKVHAVCVPIGSPREYTRERGKRFCERSARLEMAGGGVWRPERSTTAGNYRQASASSSD